MTASGCTTALRRKLNDPLKKVLDKYTEVCVCMCICVLMFWGKKEGWNEKSILNYDIPMGSLSFPVTTADPDSIHLPFPWVFCTF